MFLNLYILKDYLKIRTLAYRLSDNKNLCTLSDVSLFRQDSPLHPDILYVISSPASIQTLPHSCSGNFLFTRQTDTVFLPPEGNYLITDTADPLELLQQAQDVFQKFRRWELDLYALQNNHASLKALARTGIPFLENPLCLYTPNLRALFFLNNRPANCRPDYYFGDREGEYMSAEYANRLRFDPDYLETMHTSEPSVYSAGVFGYRTLYYNIYTDGVYIARLVLCEVFRPIRDSDFPLLKFLASFLRTSLEQQSIPVNSHPPYFDYCLTELIHNRAPEAERMNHAFEDYGWNQKDRYFCMYIPVSETEITAYTVLTFCSRLETSYIGSAAVTMDSCILFWINLTRLDMSFETAAASASALIGN